MGRGIYEGEQNPFISFFFMKLVFPYVCSGFSFFSLSLPQLHPSSTDWLALRSAEILGLSSQLWL
jgi:hypothetical protein